MKCLNEICLLNKDKECGSPCLHDEKFTCASKDLIKPKQKFKGVWEMSKKVQDE